MISRSPDVRLLALALTLASSLHAQDGLGFEVPVPAWDDIPIGSGMPTGSVGEAYAAELTGDGILDVVFDKRGELGVLVNPGHWKVFAPLSPSRDFGAFAPFPRGNQASDALLTADSSGLSVWRWDGLFFQEELVLSTLQTTWNTPTHMATWTLHSGNVLVHVFDANLNSVFRYELEPRTGPGQTTSVTVLSTITVGFPIEGMVAYNAYGNPATPGLAVARIVVLFLFSPDGFRTTLASGGIGTIGLHGFGSQSGVVDRLAWVYWLDSTPIDGDSQVGVAILGGVVPSTFVVQGFTILSSAAGTDANGHSRVVLTREGGGAWVLRACGSSPDSICFDPETTIALQTFALEGRPVLADLHVNARADQPGSYPELLLFDASGTTARVHRGRCSVPAGLGGRIDSRHIFSRASRRSLGGATATPSGQIQVNVTVPRDLVAETTQIQLMAYAWPDYEEFELDPVSLVHHVQPGGGVIQETFYPSLGVDRPRLVGIELRLLRNVGGQFEALTVENYALLREDSALAERVRMEAPSVCDGPSAGGNVRGVVRIPSLPFFLLPND